MNNAPVISIVLNAHSPFAGQMKQPFCGGPPGYLEQCFFESLSETYIPFFAMLDRLDRDRISFKIGLSLSPVFCQMLNNDSLKQRYLDYTDRQIELSRKLLEQNNDENIRKTIEYFNNLTIEKRKIFTERYNGNLIKVIQHYLKKGRLELLGTAATHSYLPFYTYHPEAIQAEIETALGIYRSFFKMYPHGFWLPEFGWNNDLDSWLRAYNFSYTMVDTHSLLLGNPPADKGTFYPSRTSSGVYVLGRDRYACSEIETLSANSVYRNNRKDIGFELPAKDILNFIDMEGGRSITGLKCWNEGGYIYDGEAANQAAKNSALLFLEKTKKRLETAASKMSAAPVCLCAFEADVFGRRWFEGMHFLETLLRAGSGVQFSSPVDYLYKLDSRSFQVLAPAFSSCGENGYAETWLDSKSDWMYRHTMRALDRMTELAEHFPDDTGLKERVLNQAAREILLLMASDWPKMLYRQENVDATKNQIESFLRNFTTIYEALGSSRISTEWLTRLEAVHNVFPNINYRVFRRKKVVELSDKQF